MSASHCEDNAILPHRPLSVGGGTAKGWLNTLVTDAEVAAFEVSLSANSKITC